MLHPPYTAWHLSYVVIGATLASHFDGGRLVATLLAFFLAVGVAAHALDELHGRPLHTQVRSSSLVAAAIVGLGGALALGVVGIAVVGPGLVVFIAIGPVLVLGYNLELFGGWLHTDLGFALAWGAFPVLTAYFVEAGQRRRGRGGGSPRRGVPFSRTTSVEHASAHRPPVRRARHGNDRNA